MSIIFIIEDEPGVNNLYEKILKKEGHQSISVTSGKEALQRINEQPVDLIICDLKLPGKPTGMDLVKKLRKRIPDCPMIVSSGYVNDELVDECEKLGVADILAKPFELSFLKDVMSKLLSQKTSKGAG